MPTPVLTKPIPPQVINEGAAYGPVLLKEYFESGTEKGAPLTFSAALAEEQSLPTGLICTGDGILTGIPAKETEGNYEVILTVAREGASMQTHFTLIIKPALLTTPLQYTDRLKSQVWQALGQNLPLPDLSELEKQNITPLDIYYLLEKWASLTIWNAMNLDAPSGHELLQLEGASPHYHVYDRGSALIAVPRDLYSQERTLVDALMTAKALAREVYQRQWTIELAGFEKMVRATWVELRHLSDQHGRKCEILHFDPTIKELNLYAQEARRMILKKLEGPTGG